MKNRSKGFTLAELMTVVAILSLLLLVAVPKFADLVRKSNEGATRGRLGALRSALSIYTADTDGIIPSDHLESLTVDGKYLKEIPGCDLPPYHMASAAVDNGTEHAGAAIFSAEVGHWVYANDPVVTGLGVRHLGAVWVGCNHSDARGEAWSSY